MCTRLIWKIQVFACVPSLLRGSQRKRQEQGLLRTLILQGQIWREPSSTPSSMLDLAMTSLWSKPRKVTATYIRTRITVRFLKEKEHKLILRANFRHDECGC